MEQEVGLSTTVAVVTCLAMSSLYVGILYAPTLLLRLPPPSSLNEFMIRRFICAAISSVISIAVCALILPISSWEVYQLLGVYGIRLDHAWQAVVFPLALTSLIYAGSLVLKLLSLMDSWKKCVMNEGDGISSEGVVEEPRSFLEWISSIVSDVLAWRTYVVAPLTEELVFRACMIPLLLCGGFKIYTVIYLCPVLFSLAHLNHWMEIYSHHNYSILKASMVVGLQLGYTVIFGSYASFLFIRTGHLLAPLVAHVFCNFMGLPVLFARSKETNLNLYIFITVSRMVSVAFVAGVIAFLWLFFPITQPKLYNDRTNNCSCWHGYCSWD